jgi:hypothetical protein
MGWIVNHRFGLRHDAAQRNGFVGCAAVPWRAKHSGVLAPSMHLVVLMLPVLLWADAPAAAHDIYSTWRNREGTPCCGGKDCAPYPAEKVKEVSGGWQLEDGVFVPYADALPSPDNQYHRCDGPPYLKARCFAVPANG